MLLFILLFIAIICLYGAIDDLIKGIIDYKISKNIVNMLQDKDTRKLFVYLRPYMEDFIEAIKNNSRSYAQMIKTYRKYLQSIKNK